MFWGSSWKWGPHKRILITPNMGHRTPCLSFMAMYSTLQTYPEPSCYLCTHFIYTIPINNGTFLYLGATVNATMVHFEIFGNCFQGGGGLICSDLRLGNDVWEAGRGGGFAFTCRPHIPKLQFSACLLCACLRHTRCCITACLMTDQRGRHLTPRCTPALPSIHGSAPRSDNGGVCVWRGAHFPQNCD